MQFVSENENFWQKYEGKKKFSQKNLQNKIYLKYFLRIFYNLPDSLVQPVKGDLNALPSFIPVHGVVPANDCSDLAVTDLLNVRLQLLQKSHCERKRERIFMLETRQKKSNKHYVASFQKFILWTSTVSPALVGEVSRPSAKHCTKVFGTSLVLQACRREKRWSMWECTPPSLT